LAEGEALLKGRFGDAHTSPPSLTSSNAKTWR
jgi:hypothetical protein